MEKHFEAKLIVETLAKAGFVAYYAGGWVRDLLLKRPSDDIDIATNASPETVQALFEKTVPIGISFGIVLVIIGDMQYEVATFRQDLEYKDGRRPTKIAFTTAEEDAKRRDFTVNGMFYDPLKEQILDFVGGRKDLEKKVIRAIGDPHERIREDRLRMIRAIRLSTRLHFCIEERTAKAIYAHVKELFPAVAIERVWQELKKSHEFGDLKTTLLELYNFGLLQEIFPDLSLFSFSEIESYLAPTSSYPKKAPLVAFILALFKKASLLKQIEICKKLKLSNQDIEFAVFLFEAKEKAHPSNAPDLTALAHFYAHHDGPTVLAILSAHEPLEKKEFFLDWHREKMAFLKPFIERIQKKEPIVNSSQLKKEGILPGPKMGKLLKEAERIAIERHNLNPLEVIEILKKGILWQS